MILNKSFGERQRQAASAPVAGVIDDDNLTSIVIVGPSVGDEIVRARLPDQAGRGWICNPAPSRKARVCFNACNSLA
jgi:hypothetical protein